MAIEDVGILSLLLKKLCMPSKSLDFNSKNLDKVAGLYERLRIPRTSAMLAASQSLGDMQLARGQADWLSSKAKEFSIWLNVKRYGTLPIMFSGAGYRYDEEVLKLLEPRAKL
jgi:hypothetical protein